MTSPMALAQQPSLEELQKRLDAARQSQQQREGAQRARDAQSGRLVIEADAACELRINGERKQALKAREPATVSVPAGEQLIDCQSAEEGEVTVREVRKVERGAQMVVMLQVAEPVARRVRAKQEQAAAAQRVAQEEAACRSNRQQVMERGAGTLAQCVTGLEWRQSDNGRDIDWNGATRHCESMSGGWRLPLVSELQGLYDPSGTLTTRCGGFTCKVSPLFRLSSAVFWSSERAGSSWASDVSLDVGYRSEHPVGYAGVNRALCVRRP